jgi:hypothetical protein
MNESIESGSSGDGGMVADVLVGRDRILVRESPFGQTVLKAEIIAGKERGSLRREIRRQRQTEAWETGRSRKRNK